MGVPGAYISDLLLQTFGLAIVLVPVALITWGVRMVRTHHLGFFGLRLSLLLLALLMMSVACVGLGDVGAAATHAGPGGLVGLALVGRFRELVLTHSSGGSLALIEPACAALAFIAMAPALGMNRTDLPLIFRILRAPFIWSVWLFRAGVGLWRGRPQPFDNNEPPAPEIGYAEIPAKAKGAGVSGQDLVSMSGGGGTFLNPNTKFPQQAWELIQFIYSPDAIKGLEFYKSIYKCCTPPGMTNAYMQEGLDAFKSGQVAMMMNWFAFFPGLYKDPNVGGDKIGFFVNPSDKGKGSQLGGQGISVVAYSPNRAEALSYIKWFATPDVQKKWWALGGYSCHKAVLNDPGFKKSAPFAAEFLDAMDQVVDFWADPSYAQLLLAEQKRIHDFVVADKGTAKEALDGLVADWKKVFKEDGKIK